MNEKELWEQIKNSLEYESIPAELHPERMKKRLLEYQTRISQMQEAFEKEDTAGEEAGKQETAKEEDIQQAKTQKTEREMKHPATEETKGPQTQQEAAERKETKEGQGKMKASNRGHWDFRRCLAGAAVFAFLCVAGASAWKLAPGGQTGEGTMVAESSPAITESEEAADTEGKGTAMTEQPDDTQPEVLGDGIYEQADDYGSVYDVLESYEKRDKETKWDVDVVETAEAGVRYVTSAADGAENTGTTESVAVVEDSAASKGEGYSTTNLQTEGVDESDIVKTDGNYIYQAGSRKVNIYDIRDGGLELLTTIEPSDFASADSILELYVQDDVLSLVISKENTDMQKKSEDVYRIHTAAVTSVMTYDISDRSDPKMIGEYTQDGYYLDSRKTGQTIYIFTTQMLGLPQVEREKAVTEDYAGVWLPCINEEPVASKDIYLPKRGENAVVVGSFDCRTPEKLIDSKMIISESAQIYVSQEAIYLYRTTYDQEENTELAKFSMKAGKLKAVGAVSVKGSILDSFAINEYNGYLRVLTTDWSGAQESNYVFVLDEKLDTVGSIQDIAEGEEIYSARFMGNTGYFVTYENTDPLFSVDFSKPDDPKVIGELKVTGFSEYLHFWGNDKLLGIGYETDPVSGMTEGIKLSMFDISNPAHVTECAKVVLANADYSPALYEYKTVLVSESENIIGFAVECYDEQSDRYDFAQKYMLYEYEDGQFHNLMAESLSDVSDLSKIRGLYAGGRFFLANEKWIAMYDRESYTLEKKEG